MKQRRRESHSRLQPADTPDPARRTLVQGLAWSGLAAGLGLPRAVVAAPPVPGVIDRSPGEIVIQPRPVNITGAERPGVLLNGSLPAPLLRWREGDTAVLRVRNELAEPTSIHWHGLVVPQGMDGVPGMSFPGIGPGETFVYELPLRQSGTYWYHSHSGYQEQSGFYGAIIIDPREPEPFAFDREYVVMFSDWTDEDPRAVHAKLLNRSDYYNFHQRTVGDFIQDVDRDGWRATLAGRWAWARSRMNPTDLADVSGYTYTHLVNGRPPGDNWTALFNPGERVRLRFINAGAMTYFDVRIPGLPMTVVAADGQYVRPVRVDEIRMANAETYDVIVTPGDQAWTIFAQSMDRTAFARATLAPRPGMSAPVPIPDPRPVLTMADMGHGHGAEPAGAATHEGSLADPHAGHAGHAGHEGQAGDPSPGPITHADTEYGPAVDMRVDFPTRRLDDPGIGLRNNGRRVLTYGDLATAGPDPDGREPGRTIELHLTGHMERYRWSFNGVRFSEAEPLKFTHGERLRIVLVNDTMMEHPIHLHGMWSDLEDENGRFKVRKHTVSVKPAQRVSFRVTADAPGRWPLHCHLMFHMVGGMFREVVVEERTGV